MLKFYSKELLLQLTNLRNGEEKLGEVLSTVSSFEALGKASQKYVLLGIPEDIGVRANYGRSGTAEAWRAGLTALCNTQNTQHNEADNFVVLGKIDCLQQMEQAKSLHTKDAHYVEKLGELVSQVDDMVSLVIEKIVAAGKIPIVIGGGHNNSFGNLKGTSKALGKPLNCINFDAHTDFRTLEHRHSGNGFNYAMEENFLNKYFIFGLHRNYTSQVQLDRMAATLGKVKYSFFEQIQLNKERKFWETLSEAEDFCCTEDFGIEIDLDAIAGMGSSAMSPTGFSVEECRHFLNYFSSNKNCRYIHICEGAPKYELFPNQIGKTIAYLVTDVLANARK